VTRRPPDVSLPVRGGRLPVWRVGSGPPVILLHGWTLDARIWDQQVRNLAKRFTVITYDRRGFGLSDAPADLREEPEDLGRLLAWSGSASASIVAMSQGTRVALAFAAACPDAVERLVLMAAPFPCQSSGRDQDEKLPLSEMRRLARAGRFADLTQLVAAQPIMAVRNDRARAQLLTVLGDYRGRDLIDESHPLEIGAEALGKISAPTLVLVGCADAPARLAAAEYLVRTVQRATLVRLRSAGHLCNLDRASQFNALVNVFLNGQSDITAEPAQRGLPSRKSTANNSIYE